MTLGEMVMLIVIIMVQIAFIFSWANSKYWYKKGFEDHNEFILELAKIEQQKK